MVTRKDIHVLSESNIVYNTNLKLEKFFAAARRKKACLTPKNPSSPTVFVHVIIVSTKALNPYMMLNLTPIFKP